MQNYTLGFVFDASLDNILLIHKTHPAWQAGKVNGLGGKIEEGEESLACMVREAREEADLATKANEWIYAGVMRGKGWAVHVYGLIYEGAIGDAHTVEEERVEWFAVRPLPRNSLENLSWLIPFVKNMLEKKDAAAAFLVEYK